MDKIKQQDPNLSFCPQQLQKQIKIYEKISAGVEGGPGRRRYMRKLLRVMNIFTILIIVTVHAYVKAHLIMYFKYVQFNVFQLYVNKALI